MLVRIRLAPVEFRRSKRFHHVGIRISSTYLYGIEQASAACWTVLVLQSVGSHHISAANNVTVKIRSDIGFDLGDTTTQIVARFVDIAFPLILTCRIESELNRPMRRQSGPAIA